MGKKWTEEAKRRISIQRKIACRNQVLFTIKQVESLVPEEPEVIKEMGSPLAIFNSGFFCCRRKMLDNIKQVKGEKKV